MQGRRTPPNPYGNNPNYQHSPKNAHMPRLGSPTNQNTDSHGKRGKKRQSSSYECSTEDIQLCMRQTYVAAITIGEADVRAWELISDVPILHNIWAYVCFGLNLLIPGTGTILAAMLGKTEFDINKT